MEPKNGTLIKANWYVKAGQINNMAICQQIKATKILSSQFKQESNGNSGVFFRSSIDGVKISGWQCEVAPLNNHTGGIYESYGRGWLIQPNPLHERYLKTGKWNKLKLEVKGDEVTTWLNGHMMINLKDEKIGTGTGFIALQIHDGGGIKVRWKKLMIEELP